MSKQPKPAKGRRNGQKAKGEGKSEFFSAPLARQRLMKTQMPYVSGSQFSGDGRVRIRHREYIADVAGSVAYAATSYAVNPGLGSSFTWMAPVAAQFESYLFSSLTFEFETQKSASTSGSVMMAMDFDASDLAPANKQQLMSYHNAVRSGVWQECRYVADRKDLQKFGVQRYIRSGVPGADQDIKTYDVGNLVIATQGCADTSAIGELYVVYEVELITPQSDVVASTSSLSREITSATSITRAAPFGTAATYLGGLAITATSATITFSRVGRYILLYRFVGTGATEVNPTITGTATSTTVFPQQYAAGSALSGVGSYTVVVNNIGDTMIFDFTASATTITAMVTRIGQYSTA